MDHARRGQLAAPWDVSVQTLHPWKWAQPAPCLHVDVRAHERQNAREGSEGEARDCGLTFPRPASRNMEAQGFPADVDLAVQAAVKCPVPPHRKHGCWALSGVAPEATVLVSPGREYGVGRVALGGEGAAPPRL